MGNEFLGKKVFYEGGVFEVEGTDGEACCIKGIDSSFRLWKNAEALRLATPEEIEKAETYRREVREKGFREKPTMLNRYIIATCGGHTQAPDGSDIENAQILDFVDATDKDNAIEVFEKFNKPMAEAFKDENLQVYKIDEV